MRIPKLIVVLMLWWIRRHQQKIAILLVIFLAGCGSSPTAPSPVPPPVVVVVPPPVVVVPPVVTTNPLLSDPRYDPVFYRQFVSRPLYRWTKAPLVYVRSIDDRGGAIDPRIVESTAAAIINTTSLWAGGQFGVAGLERGTETRETSAGWLTVKWSTTLALCGEWSPSTPNVITISTVYRECACPSVIKHELGHAMGYLHTDNDNDLMTASFQAICDRNPSAREVFHSRVAYTTPVGSLAP